MDEKEYPMKSEEEISAFSAEDIAAQPLEEPEEAPMEEAANDPVAEPMEEAVEEPSDEPMEEPLEAEDTPLILPVVEEEPVDDTIISETELLDEPVEAPMEESLGKPTDEPVDALLEEPLEMPAEKPTAANLSGAPTELFTPIPDVSKYDPLDDADSLPSLFPQKEQPPQEPVPVTPTVVPRPKKKKKTGWYIVRRITFSLFKWLIALVLAVAVLVAGLLGYLTMTEYSPGYAEKAQYGSKQISTAYSSSMPLRVVTFNTGYGGLGEDSDFFMDGGEGVTPESEELVKTNMIGIERILSEIDADIIFLQEVDTDSKRSYGINQWLQYEYDLSGYESRFALNYSCDYVPYPIGDFIGKVHSGIATYSRFNILSATRYSLPCPFSWPTRVANLKRCLLVTRIPIEDSGIDGEEKELVLINFHLEAYDDGEGKAAQTQQLMELIQAEYEEGNYVIAGGDFNQTFPDSDAYPIVNKAYFTPGLLDVLPDDWQYAYDDSVPTSRLLNEPYDPRSDATQYYVIDGFIVSPNVTIKNVQTLNEGFVYSDHNPVVLDIELN